MNNKIEYPEYPCVECYELQELGKEITCKGNCPLLDEYREVVRKNKIKLEQEAYLEGCENSKQLFELMHKIKLNDKREEMIFNSAYLFGRNDMKKDYFKVT